MGIKKSVIYDLIQEKPDEFDQLFHEIANLHKDDINLPQEHQECRVVIVYEATQEFGAKDDVYLVLVGKYNKESQEFTYEGVYEGYDIAEYQYQGESNTEELYTNTIKMVSQNIQERNEPVESRYTEDALDVLNLVHIYSGDIYRNTLGLSMKITIIPDEDTNYETDTIDFNNEWNVLGATNLVVIHVQD